MSGTKTLNPKTLMGRKKLPMFSVVSPIALMHMSHAMRYGAFEALKADGGHGYGPFNWREIAIEYSTYTDAAVRHIAQFSDGEDYSDIDSRVHHLGHAMATLGILLDAIEVGSAVDDRPLVGRGATTRVMDRLKKIHAVHLDEPKTPSAADLTKLAATIPAPPPTLADVQALLDKVVLPEGVSSYGITEISPHPAMVVARRSECPNTEGVQTLDPIGGVPLDEPVHPEDCPGGCGGRGRLLFATSPDDEWDEPCTIKAGGTD